jgi:PAS domain S-box-containing protein
MGHVNKENYPQDGIASESQIEGDFNNFPHSLFKGNFGLLPVLENAPLAIVITDSDGKIKYANSRTEVVFGYALEELRGKKIEYLLPEHLRKKHIGYRNGFNKNPYTRPMGIGLDLIGRRKSGEEFPVEIGLSQFSFNDHYIICYITDISERKRIQNELVSSEVKFRTLIDVAPDAVILLNNEGLVLQANRTCEEVFLFSQDELTGQPVTNLFLEINQQNKFEQHLENCLHSDTQGIEDGFEISATRKDGTKFPVEIKLSQLVLNNEVMVIAIIRDITERKRTERELRILGQIAQQMKDAVILTPSDPSSKILYVNDAFTDLYGYTQEDVIGKPSWILFAGDDTAQKAIQEKRVESINLQGQFRGEYQDRRKDGSLFWVSNTSSVIQLDDETNYDLGIVRDITERVEFQELLGKQNEFLAALHETSINILGRLDLSDVLESLIQSATSLLNSNHGNIFLFDQEKKVFECKVGVGLFSQYVGSRIKLGAGFIGSVDETGQPFIVNFALNDRDCLGIILPSEIKVVICVPLYSGETLMGVICVASDDETGLTYGDREVDMLNHFGQLASIAIQNAQFFKEIERSRKETKLRNFRMEKELEIARSVQVAMLPRELPDVRGWSFGVRWKPALEVSGDYYDVVLRKGKYLDLMIADVTDKGVPAALFMAQSKALLGSFLEISSSLLEGIILTNQSLIRENVGPFVTMFLARINTETGETEYINAGHHPPLLYRHADNQIIQLKNTGLPLGIESNLNYEQHYLKLEENDFLVLYTDGVTEAMDQHYHQFGDERLIDAVKRYRDRSANDIAKNLLNEIDDFIGFSQPSDDIAIVITKRL